MKKHFKDLSLIAFGICLGLTLSVFAYSYLAEEVGFNPKADDWDVDNVRDALDSFRDIASHCPFGCEYTVGEPAIEAHFTGAEEIHTIACTGRYKLEVWGASGNLVTATYAHTGYGGYSVGTMNLEVGDTIYINVGGAGASSIKGTAPGGYNGGGNGKDYYDGRGAGSGGGATHIAKVSGELKYLESFKGGFNNATGVYVSDKILIAAGGGGGVGNHQGLFTYNLVAGSGGGATGVTGFSPGSGTNYYGYGGTQSAGGTATTTSDVYQGTAGTFGFGGDCLRAVEGNCSGGGGGFYGGGSNTNYSGAAGGGSGYIGNAGLTEKAMFCYNCTESDNFDSYTISTYGTTTHSAERNPECTNGYSNDAISGCAKAGNGYVRITYLGS